MSRKGRQVSNMQTSQNLTDRSGMGRQVSTMQTSQNLTDRSGMGRQVSNMQASHNLTDRSGMRKQVRNGHTGQVEKQVRKWQTSQEWEDMSEMDR